MNLTGEYDVVLEVSVAAMNRILAAIHENQDPRYPVLPHTMRMAIDDSPRGPADPVPESERTGIEAQVEIQTYAPTMSLPQGGPIFEGMALAGVMARSRFGRWDPWESSDISIRTGIRAWVKGSPEPSLPEFLHGDLVVNANVVKTRFDLPTDIGPVMFRAPGLDLPWGDTFIGLECSSMTVTFEPAPGTTISDEERLRVQQVVSNTMRSDLNPVTFKVEMPSDVRRWDHKLDPQHASVMVLLLLTEGGLSPNAVQGVPGGFVPPGADFAIAVGAEYLLGEMRRLVFQGFPPAYTFSKLGVSATVRPDWANADLHLEPGRISVSVHGDGTISWWGIDDSFTFDVRLWFGLQVIEGSLEVVPLGDPEAQFHDIAVGEDYIEGKARDQIRQERDAALAAARESLREALEVQSRLEDVVAAFHPSPAAVTLTGVEIRPEGVVVPGRIGLAPSRPAVVRQVKREGMVDAVDSWIPGGTIDRFVWSSREVVVSPGALAGPPIYGSGSGRIEEHRFVTEDIELPLADVWSPLLCLELQGRRLTAGGAMAPITGHSCGFYVPLPVWPLIDWPVRGGRTRPVLPVRGARPDGEVGLVGHYDPWASGRAPTDGASTLLVHFASGRWEEAARVLKEGLSKAGEAAVVTVVLLPSGSLGEATGGLDTGTAVVVGEDPDGQWAEAFGVSAPATVLVDSKGQVAWKDEGDLTATTLSRALGRHAERGGKVSVRPLRLGIGAGDVVPEFSFQVNGGATMTVRRLRGRRMVLAFWASWSEPSLEQLRELKNVYEDGAGLLVLAVGDGESERATAELARAEGLPFPVVPDPHRKIARRFAVGCWPTTIWVGPTLTVEAVDFGLTPLGGGHAGDGKVGPAARR